MATARPSGVYNESYAREFAIVRTRWQWLLLILGLIWLYTLPLYCSGYMLSIVNLMGISLLAVLGLSILTGYCGQISIGQSAFVGVGAYTSTILMTAAGFSFWAALPCAGLAAGFVGLIFGLPSLRVKGFYLVMATLAAQFIIPWVFGHVATDLTGGVYGLMVPAITLMGSPLTSQASLFFVIISLALGGIYFAKNLVRTRVGRAFVAIRDNDLAAEVMGINPFYYKLLAFFICSIYAGIAGALWATWLRAINPEHFGLMDSVMYLGMMIVGGMGSISGACFGTIFIIGLEELARRLSPVVGPLLGMPATTAAPALMPIVFGLIILLFLIFEPRGLAHRWQIFKASYRLWPFSY